jgi:hypothetical protein
MENEKFEKKLKEMKKPEVTHLKHEDMLSNAISNAKDKSVVSLWWLSIPLFITAMLMMKSMYMPGTSLISNLKELAASQRYIFIVFFIASPLVLILVNILTIRKIYVLSGSPKSLNFLEAVWVNVLMIVLSVLILIIYSL